MYDQDLTEVFLSIWLVLWIVLSLALLFFLGWTLTILLKQKKAWRAYAKKHKLRYRSQQMFGVPEVSGAMGDYTVNIFGFSKGKLASGNRRYR